MVGAAAFAAAVQRGQKPYSSATAIRNDRAFSSIVSRTTVGTHSYQQTGVVRPTSRQQDDRSTGRADDYDGLLIPERDGETDGFVRREMQSVLLSSKGSTGSGEHAGGRRRSLGDRYAPQLSKVQKKGCFQYIKRRHSTAVAFASNARNLTTLDDEEPPFCDQANADATDTSGSNWEYIKSKHGVHVYKSKRSRCEVRAVTQVNASVKNVMALLSAGESTESFAHAQKILLGGDQVYDAKVLASCVPSSGSRYFHCGLKYMAMKNPFGVTPLDLVFLDYTDVSTSPDDKLVGFRIIESIRVPEFRALPKYTRASIRCEVYIVRETNEKGVVEVTFASHLDPKSKYSSSKKTHWLDLAATRLQNLRSYAEKASFSHRMILEKGNWIKRDSRRNCSVCESSFTFLRKRHNCRLCGEVSCGRCCRKLPILVDTETTRVRVCLGCILESRRQPDELGRTELDDGNRMRRQSLGNATFVVYDEADSHEDEEQDSDNAGY